jgi:replication factor C subunit 3/5
MVLWVDKYRPTSFSQLDIHSDVTGRLEKMISSGDFPHILLWGNSGSGKKTRVHAILRALYGKLFAC